MPDPGVRDTRSEEDPEQAREIGNDNEILPSPAMKGGKSTQADLNFPCLTALIESSE